MHLRAGPARGPFVTLEGPEGAGKTTQAARLRDRLDAAGLATILLREPGGTRLGESIRTLLLERRSETADEPRITARADALLFNAARAQLVDERIAPALAAGTLVICSRFTDSTLAYQGYGMGLPLDELRILAEVATGGIRPDLTVLLDVPVEAGLARKLGEETRFEAEFDLAFHRRVREGFLALASAEPDRFVVIDGTASPEVVGAAIDAALWERLGLGVREETPTRNRSSVRTEPNAAPVRMNR
jgi:dTMP kinase